MTSPVHFHTLARKSGFIQTVSVLARLAHWRRCAAFSLVEVVLAVGVLASSFVVIFGLLPFGMGMMSSSIDSTIGMQVVQRVTTLARQAKFSELGKLDRNPGTESSSEKADFFFDDEGVEVEDAVDTSHPRVVYSVAVVLLPQTTLPGAEGAQISTANIATINMIIRKNASTKPLRVVNALIANNGL